jgi:hypothetical protein
MFDLTSIAETFGFLRSALGLVKDAKDLLPKHQQKVVDETLQKADQASRIAEAKLAQDLGYQLCQCTWPPRIMRRTSTGDVQSRAQHTRWETWTCLGCRQPLTVPVKKGPPDQ